MGDIASPCFSWLYAADKHCFEYNHCDLFFLKYKTIYAFFVEKKRDFFLFLLKLILKSGLSEFSPFLNNVFLSREAS